MIVVVNSLVNSFDEHFYRLVLMGMAEFQLEFPIVGFLPSVFPGGSFLAHGRLYAVTHEKIENEEAPVFASLVAVEYFWDGVRLNHGHGNRFKHEFLCMDERDRIPQYLPREGVDDGREIQVPSVVDDMGKIRPPYGVRTDGRPSFREVLDFRIGNIPVFRFHEPFRYARFGGYRERLHEPSRPFEPHFQIPGDTPVAVPGILFMEGIEGGFEKGILRVEGRLVIYEGTRR